MGTSTLKIRRVQWSVFNSDPAKPPVASLPPAESVEGGNLIQLRIRPEQQRVFEQAALKNFEDEMVVHSNNFSPQLCGVIGEEQLRVALRQAMVRAGVYGFTYRGPIRLFIEMMFLFGSAFDTDPQYPWAAKILGASDDQMKRAEQLFDRILDYQKRVFGPENVNLTRALGEYLGLAQKPLTFPRDEFITGMRREMRNAFPEKAACIGDEALAALINQGSGEARKYHFPKIRGEAIMALLMFGFGHGCANDPLYPWIERTLTDDKIIDPEARAGRLEKKAATWLEHIIGASGEGAQT